MVVDERAESVAIVGRLEGDIGDSTTRGKLVANVRYRDVTRRGVVTETKFTQKILARNEHKY